MVKDEKGSICGLTHLLSMLETFLVAKPMFWSMGNHLGQFSEASYQPEGQELDGGAVKGKK